MRIVPGSGFVLQRVMRAIQPRFNFGVVGVLLDPSRERLLLVEHVFHPTFPWGLPGGWINRGEDPAETIVREIEEELGLRVRAVRPLMVQRAAQTRGLMDIFFLCVLADDYPHDAEPPIRLSSELLAYRWVRPDELDDGPRLIAMQVEAIRVAFETPEHCAAH